MAVAAAAVGVVSTVAGVVQNNMATSAQNKAITLQQQANERAGKIRVMGIELQQQQLKQQTELEKLNVQAQRVQYEAALDMTALQRRMEVAQQLAGIDMNMAEAVLQQVSQQYEVARRAFDEQQNLSLQRTQELNQGAQQLGQLSDQNEQLLQAVRQNDRQLSEMLARQIGEAYGSTGAEESISRQQTYQVLNASMDSQQYQAALQEQLATSGSYADFLNNVIERSLSSNQEVLRLRGEGANKTGNAMKSSVGAYNRASQNVEGLAKALVPGITAAGNLQADINYGYSNEALENAKLESRYGTASQNAGLEASRRRGNILGDLAAVAQSAVPLVQQVGYYNAARQKTTSYASPIRLDTPVFNPSPTFYTPTSLGY